MTATATTTGLTGTPRRRWPVWILTLTAATALPLLIWAVTDPIAGHPLVAESGGTVFHVDAGTIPIGAAVTTACGLGVAAVLNRTARPARNWVITAATVTVLSLPSTLGGTTALTVAVLMLMHLVVGAVALVGGLRLLARLGRL
ncbi:hypothetical protein LX16_0616 [Stackebrandtia albiflava]|uniref:Uncharacterized protein n=1 Tax=Stackebrandtia albiflava TaxID=406432 RepID=A0A562VAL7_9ACTN|nr:DUF6069 family protein [Stackebrandtia albiflava]TWJ14922.1 hypothetical protein LX16_0616 [Stackebrandtia albiflava]